jgi:hypothetical protein
VSERDAQYEYEYCDFPDAENGYDVNESDNPPIVIVAKLPEDRSFSDPQIVWRKPTPVEPESVIVATVPHEEFHEEVVEMKNIEQNLCKTMPAVGDAVTVVRKPICLHVCEAHSSEEFVQARRHSFDSQNAPEFVERLRRSSSVDSFELPGPRVRGDFRPEQAQLIAPRPSRLRDEKPHIVATLEAKGFQKVREAGGNWDVPRRRTITADGKEYESDYDYGSADYDIEDPTPVRSGSGPRCVMSDFPKLQSRDFERRQSPRPPSPQRKRRSRDEQHMSFNEPSEVICSTSDHARPESNEELSMMVEKLRTDLKQTRRRRDVKQRKLDDLRAATEGRTCARAEFEKLYVEPTIIVDEKVMTNETIKEQEAFLALQQKQIEEVSGLEAREKELEQEIVQLEKEVAAVREELEETAVHPRSDRRFRLRLRILP